MDRRLTFANARIAHSGLVGKVCADRFDDGTWHQLIAPTAPLLNAPHGTRDREVLFGEAVRVLEITDDHAFVCLQKDGYVGYVGARFLATPARAATHRLSAVRSYAKITPDFKTYEPHLDLSFGSRATVTGTTGRWSEIAIQQADNATKIQRYFIPSSHLTPLDQVSSDPAAIAELFLGTPYVWGGNSTFGIDCSGLVQAALLACNIPCPGDSDLQQNAFEDASGPYQRGDLLFWKGHVAIVVDHDRLIHANAFHMAVAYEATQAAISRILAQGDGAVTAHKRPTLKGST